MIDVNSDKCVSCGVCSLVCPKSCISIEINDIGEYSPRINTDECINCGKCDTLCIAENNNNVWHDIKDFYYGWSNNENIRIRSSSGGIFYALAEKFLKMAESFTVPPTPKIGP